jgi:hypothetical protein
MKVQEVSNKLKNEASFLDRAAELKELETEEQLALERARKSPFRRFGQINFDDEYFFMLIDIMEKNTLAGRLFLFFAKEMDGFNQVIFPHKMLMEIFEVSRVSISKAITYLKEEGFIVVVKVGNMNSYGINSNLIWKSQGTNYKHSYFTAKIGITSTEQEQDLELAQKKHSETLGRYKKAISQSEKLKAKINIPKQ